MPVGSAWKQIERCMTQQWKGLDPMERQTINDYWKYSQPPVARMCDNFALWWTVVEHDNGEMVYLRTLMSIKTDVEMLP